MPLSDLIKTPWTPLQKRHASLAVTGTLVSWSVAVLVACASPGVKPALYIQLGGLQALQSITDRTMDRVATDPVTRRTFDGVNLKTLKASVAAYVCKAADGPCVYEGETMANSHAQLNIQGSEFDRMVTVLREELNRADVPEGAKNELLRRLAPTRRDIVKP